ncbi:MAG: ATP citrate lyase citrate-binding domain-containing protein [Chloroflexota bacterium]|nr:ATP citrate lyase citrate-binding domain-containing protein [Chloroflexota bacterium]
MARRAIREYDAKQLLAKYLPDYLEGFAYPGKVALVTPETDWDELVAENPWLKEEKLVVKPDQLFGKRGKMGLLGLNLSLDEAKAWIDEHMGRDQTIGKVTDKLTHFLVEPFTPHEQEDEMFLAIRTEREADVIYFSLQGGIDIEENWENVIQIRVPILSNVDEVDIARALPDFSKKESMVRLTDTLYKLFCDLGFTYLEINPFVFVDNEVIPLDFVAKLDDTAAFECGPKWGDIPFPASFGTRLLTPEEEYIRSLDEKTGASLKLRVLNPKGHVWTLVAGGGASIVYADTISDLGFGREMANYGEYSGGPSKEETYEYAKTILDLMTRKPDPEGKPKFLLIGGGIANFTDVAKTFAGIIQALEEYREDLIANNVKIYVRRGGPNYQEGLRMMRDLGERLGVPMEVYGPETHMTKIVPMALRS